MPLLGASLLRKETDPLPSKALDRVLFLWFLTIGVVFVEPAPFDLLFLPIAAWVFATNKLHRMLTPGTIFALTVAYLTINLLSLIGIEQQSRAIFFMLVTAYLFAFAGLIALIVHNYGHKGIETMLSAYVIVAVISALLGTAGTLDILPAPLNDLVTLHGGRAKAFFKDPNVYSPFLALAFIYVLDQYLAAKRNHFRYFALVSLLSIGILVSFSRAAWISTLFSVFAYFILMAIAEGRFKRILVYFVYLTVFSLILGSLLALFVEHSNLSDFIIKRSTFQQYDRARFHVQELAAQAGLENFFGIGPGQSEIMFAPYEAIGSGAAQSIFVRVLCEQGILGAFFFGLILILTAFKALKLCISGDKARTGLHCVFSSAYFSTLVCGLVIDTLHWRHFFLILGVIWGLHAATTPPVGKKRPVIGPSRD